MKLALLTAVQRQPRGVITLIWPTPRSSDPTDSRGGSSRVRAPTRLVAVAPPPMITPPAPAVAVAVLAIVSRVLVAAVVVAVMVAVTALLAGNEANITVRLLPAPPHAPPPVAAQSVKVRVGSRMSVSVMFSTGVALLFSSVIV